MKNGDQRNPPDRSLYPALILISIFLGGCAAKVAINAAPGQKCDTTVVRERYLAISDALKAVDEP